MLTGPADSVYKLTTLARWQRDWINDHRSINFSGLCQDMINNVIEKNDPEYFAKFEKARKFRKMRREEQTREAQNKHG